MVFFPEKDYLGPYRRGGQVKEYPPGLTQLSDHNLLYTKGRAQRIRKPQLNLFVSQPPVVDHLGDRHLVIKRRLVQAFRYFRRGTGPRLKRQLFIALAKPAKPTATTE